MRRLGKLISMNSKAASATLDTYHKNEARLEWLADFVWPSYDGIVLLSTQQQEVFEVRLER